MRTIDGVIRVASAIAAIAAAPVAAAAAVPAYGLEAPVPFHGDPDRCELSAQQQAAEPQDSGILKGLRRLWAGTDDVQKDDSPYYLRSPLLLGYLPRTTGDCTPQPEPLTLEPDESCAELSVVTREGVLQMKAALPQMGARTSRRLGAVIEEGLQKGQPIQIQDRRGNTLTIYPTLTKDVLAKACRM